MTGNEQNRLDRLERRLFGDDGTGGAIGVLTADVGEIKEELGEWRGAIRAVKGAAVLFGLAASIASLLVSLNALGLL